MKNSAQTSAYFWRMLPTIIDKLFREEGVELDEIDQETGKKLRLYRNHKANLSKAFLRGVNFRKANLQRASLSNANLQGANLWNANLQEANLFDANLQGADLSNANLQRAYFYNADITEVKNANFTRAEGVEQGEDGKWWT